MKPEKYLQADFANFETVTNIAKNMQQNNLYDGGLTEENITSLETILADDRPIIGPMALALLKCNNPNYEFSEFVYDVPQNSERRMNPNAETSAIAEDAEFKIYPNPTKDYTTLSYNCKFANMSYSILDMQGKMLITESLITIEDKVANEVLVDLSNLSNGSYQIIINTNNTALWSEKLIKTE